ncbi:cytochrome b/b6 domain-containing protein [uncultured Shimia sp.]|uniref:cytochrome b/b6 domain-containing protein n=1 Tax=uncultured Shimia sp. TaxID=573152 RepID=UPI00262723CE|nr:cytochrome b/b6 domain-containing protein [uncultured Shimia sp.]
MPLSNTTRDYGSVTKTFHWLTALLILTALALGLTAQWAAMGDGEEILRKAWLFSLHKTVGLSAFFVALLRIFWSFSQTRPGLLNNDHRLEATAAHTAHWLLYGSMVLAPLTGWLHHAATTGFAPILWPFGQSLPFVPKSESLAELTASLHFLFILVLAGSILAHAGGAMKHFVIDRDQTLQRMLPGQHTAPTPSPEPKSRLPLVVALGVWAAVITGGIFSGQFSQHHQSQDTTTTLEAAPSDWQVTSGTLEISVHQFGSDVTGSFSDWRAAITFEDDARDGKHGTVATQIAIGSLTLGSVSEQALGADFLDATAFPTATFVADILSVELGFVAEGTLTLKGVTIPVILPFTLTRDGDKAVMQGETTLDRRDFAIGASMPDESSLKFAVVVTINLEATRRP